MKSFSRSRFRPPLIKMTLKEYKKRFGVTYVHIAYLCGVQPVTIRNIASGHSRPSKRLASIIHEVTGGHVSNEQWPRRGVRKRKSACVS